MRWWIFGKPDFEQEIESLAQSVIGLLALIERPGFSQPLRTQLIARLQLDLEALDQLKQNSEKSEVVKRLFLMKTKFHSGGIWQEMKKFPLPIQRTLDAALEVVEEKAKKVQILLQ